MSKVGKLVNQCIWPSDWKYRSTVSTLVFVIIIEIFPKKLSKVYNSSLRDVVQCN